MPFDRATERVAVSIKKDTAVAKSKNVVVDLTVEEPLKSLIIDDRPINTKSQTFEELL